MSTASAKHAFYSSTEKPPVLDVHRDMIPAALRDRPQWVGWRLVWEPDKNGGGDCRKVPFNPRTGEKAKPNDPSTWGTLDEALDWRRREGAEGIGYVFTVDDPFVGVDLDDAIVGGVIEPWAQEVVRDLDTYYEISPSGTGLKAIGQGSLPANCKHTASITDADGNVVGKIEVYDRLRYFALTGHQDEVGWPRELRDCQTQLDTLIEKYGLRRQPPPATPPSSNGHRPREHNRRKLVERARAYIAKEPPAISFQRGHDRLYHVTMVLIEGFGLTDAEARPLLDEYSARCKPPWSEQELAHKLESCRPDINPARLGHLANAPPVQRAVKEGNGYKICDGGSFADQYRDASAKGKPADDAGHPAGNADETSAPDDLAGDEYRPTINVGPRFQHAAIQEAQKILAADPTMYIRGGLWVHIEQATVKKKQVIDRHGATPPVIRITSTALISAKLDDKANWIVIRKNKAGNLYAQQSALSGRNLKAVTEWTQKDSYGARDLQAVSSVPFIRDDGEVVQTAGYDEASRVLYLPQRDYPFVPPLPSLDDAKRAAEQLLDIVCDIPFFMPHHRSAWLSLVLTLAGRHFFPGDAPVFAASANQPGVGKDLCIDLGHIGVFGRRLPTAKWPASEEERDKRMLAIAIEGDPCVLLSNVSEPLGGETLEMALTAGSYKGRILGFTQMQTMPLNTVFCASGNNLQYSNDGMARRVVPITQYYGQENPDERTGFKHSDVRAHTMQQHPQLVVAALTILRAFHVAGLPDSGAPPIGSFEPWSRTIRNAVIWLGHPDPAAGRKEAKENHDNATDSFVRFLQLVDQHRLKFYLPDKSDFSVAHLRKVVEHGIRTEEFVGGIRMNLTPDPTCETMRDALAGMTRYMKSDMPSGVAIGHVLKRMRGRVFSSLRLDQVTDATDHDKGSLWKVTPCET